MNFHWILIALTTTPTVYSHVTAVESAANLSPKLLDIIRLASNTYIFRFDNIYLSFIPVIIAFSAVLLKPKDKMVAYFAIVAALSIFLGKGVNPPLASIYSWLSLHLPGSALFRDVYHIAFIPALAYSVLIGKANDRLSEIGSGRIASTSVHYSGAMRKLKKINMPIIAKIVVPLVLALLLVYSVNPIFTGNFNNNVQVYDLGNNYSNAFSYLQNLPGDFRIAWLPMASLGTSSSSTILWAGRNPVISAPPKPSFDADGLVWQRYPAFLDQTISTNRTAYFSQLLAFAGVKYVVTAADFLGHYPTPWNQTQLLDNQVGFDLVNQIGNIRVFENSNYLPLIYSTNDVTVVGGDLSTLTSLSYYNQYLSKEFPNTFFSPQLTKSPSSTDNGNNVIIQDNDYQDLAFSFIPHNYIITAGAYAPHNTPLNGWTYGGYLWTYDWHLTTALDDIAVTATNDTLVIPVKVQEPTEYLVWARVYFGMENLWGVSDQNTSLSFSIDNQNVGSVVTTISTDSWDQGYKWVDLGSLQLAAGNHNIQILGKNGVNAIERIAVAPSTVLTEAFDNLNKYLLSKNILLLSNVEKTAEDNDLLVASTQWSNNASEGVALVSKAPTELSSSIFVPTTGDYEVFLRTTNPEFINAKTDNSTPTLSPSGDFKWLDEGSAHFTQGYNNLSTYIGSPGVGVDLIALEHVSNKQSVEAGQTDISYSQVNPTKYSIHVNASEPFFLIFSENFDPSWHASIAGFPLEHFEVNAFANAFYVNKTGNFTITLDFTLENLHEVGLASTFVSVIGCVSLIVIPKRYFYKARNKIIDKVK
jgi:hypothetical protein